MFWIRFLKGNVVIILTIFFSIFALMSLARLKKASSTLMDAFADVSINLIEYSQASSSPRSLETWNQETKFRTKSLNLKFRCTVKIRWFNKCLVQLSDEFIIPNEWIPVACLSCRICFQESFSQHLQKRVLRCYESSFWYFQRTFRL